MLLQVTQRTAQQVFQFAQNPGEVTSAAVTPLRERLRQVHEEEEGITASSPHHAPDSSSPRKYAKAKAV